MSDLCSTIVAFELFAIMDYITPCYNAQIDRTGKFYPK